MKISIRGYASTLETGTYLLKGSIIAKLVVRSITSQEYYKRAQEPEEPEMHVGAQSFQKSCVFTTEPMLYLFLYILGTKNLHCFLVCKMLNEKGDVIYQGL